MGLMQVDEHDVDHKQQPVASVKSSVDKYKLFPEFLKVRGLVKQHLHSFNYFVNTGIKKIVRANDRLVSTVNPSIYIRYAAPIMVDIEYTTLGSHPEKTMQRKDVTIGRMPIMLRSCCCILYGKDEAELARLGECPLDPEGYFIIKGTEKVLLIQEQLSKNRIIIDTDNKGNINASVTSNTELVKSKTVIQMEKGKVYLILNQFVNKIPIMVVLKAMGMESDQEVVQMIGRDPRFSALLLPSIEDYVGNKRLELSSQLVSLLFEDYVGNKRLELSSQLVSLLFEDYVGNKRLELSSQLVSLLFEDLFKTTITQSQNAIDIILKKLNKASRFDPTPLKLIDWNFFIISDSLTAVSWINNSDLGHINFMHMIFGIRNILGRLGQTNVEFSSRASNESNGYADILAKKGAEGVDESRLLLVFVVSGLLLVLVIKFGF
ncbi:hypothetical protein Ddye_019042 [Dipteronia dyeriana]|uniref:DNA-directed RNA polymerase n=1 Tax=Dipteronia dyeriana TaxID=168575 RepID=A0AAD9WVC6_9ROSI|nr:hypothetical protein Ddye_019042 [Dipteronia dyeriana]